MKMILFGGDFGGEFCFWGVFWGEKMYDIAYYCLVVIFCIVLIYKQLHDFNNVMKSAL